MSVPCPAARRAPFVSAVPLLVLLALLAGCAAQSGLESDLPALRRAYDQARTQEYPDVSVERVVKASARIFQLAQGGYAILAGKGGVVAARERASVDKMLDGEPGDYWYVDVRPSGSGVVVRVRRAGEPDPNTSLRAEDHAGGEPRLVHARTIDPEVTRLSELTDSGAAYVVFFKRLDWLLARNDYWLYCRAAEEYVKMEKLEGDLDAFCLGAGDKRPAMR